MVLILKGCSSQRHAVPGQLCPQLTVCPQLLQLEPSAGPLNGVRGVQHMVVVGPLSTAQMSSHRLCQAQFPHLEPSGCHVQWQAAATCYLCRCAKWSCAHHHTPLASAVEVLWLCLFSMCTPACTITMRRCARSPCPMLPQASVVPAQHPTLMVKVPANKWLLTCCCSCLLSRDICG